MIVWDPNKAIDIGRWSICEGGRLERLYSSQSLLQMVTHLCTVPFLTKCLFVTNALSDQIPHSLSKEKILFWPNTFPDKYHFRFLDKCPFWPNALPDRMPFLTKCLSWPNALPDQMPFLTKCPFWPNALSDQVPFLTKCPFWPNALLPMPFSHTTHGIACLEPLMCHLCPHRPHPGALLFEAL